MASSSSTFRVATEGPRPFVSIIVPTHHRPDTLARLLEAVRSLTYSRSRFELIVVGGVDDRARQVVQKFAESVDFPAMYRCVSKDDLGSASFKRNEGAHSARGDILAFTDDDCVVHPDWITAAVPYFGSGVGGVEGAVEIPRPDPPTVSYRRSLGLSQPGGYQTCNMLYRKSVFEEFGGFDLAFPYYLEDTDLAYTVMEAGYIIPFAASAVVMHPVPPPQPLKLLAVARPVEQMPYLFLKHARSKRELRASIKPFNRSHYFYLSLYAAVALRSIANPLSGIQVLGLGLCILLPVHLAHDFWGLHFTASELALTALCQPIVPILRLYYWLKGRLKMRLAGRKPQQVDDL